MIFNEFRYIEKCLFNYPLNMAQLKILQADLTVLKASYDFQSRSYLTNKTSSTPPSSPVEKHLEKIQVCENKIKKLECMTEGVTIFINELRARKNFQRNREYKKLLDLFYFGGASLAEIAKNLKMSRATIFRRRREIVGKVASYLRMEK